MVIDKNLMINELKLTYGNDVLREKFGTTDLTELDESIVKKEFEQMVKENSEFIQIQDVYSEWEKGTKFLVDTPDGFQFASRFIKKSKRACYDLRAVNFHIECSGDHLIETENGWIPTEDIKIGDKILTRVGFEEVTYNERIEDREVYDMTIEHENHRYWGGAGISSHNSGKSFLVSKSIVEAQKNGYMVVVLDSEQAMSQDYLEKIGVDTSPDKLMTVQVTTVEQTQNIVVTLLNEIKEEQEAAGNKEDIKLLLIIDSLGLLSSDKAMNDAESGKIAADMGTKAKALTKMFTAITQKIGLTETVCIVTNHGAMEVGAMFPQLKPKGGQCLTAGTKVQTKDGMKNIEDIKVGDEVKTHMDRFKPVVKLFDFDDLDILEVELENGQIIEMTPEHKMLVERNGEKIWLEAKELTLTDKFLQLEA